MFVILPLFWIGAWLLVAGLIAAFSGLSPKGEGLTLFLIIFAAGGVGLPLLGGLGWMISRRLRSR